MFGKTESKQLIDKNETSIRVAGFYMYDRYKIQKELGEHGAYEYKIVDNNDLEIVEVYDDLKDAEDALKFWNQ